jgi:uncharacterized hydrophobic protein (TIGR00271 family)
LHSMQQRLFPFITDERRSEVLQELELASSPASSFFALTVLSCIVATFGLITDSASAIIGAMLIAPLMSPILGLSVASVAGRQQMFRRALLALFEGAILAISLAAVLAWLAEILPFDVLADLPREVTARTRPTPFDLGVALAGGAAAAYALAHPKLSAALPGVAIATALMPPLCTVGIGIALDQTGVWAGALLLFATNFVAIAFAGIAVFAALGFRPIWDNGRRELYVAGALVLLVTVPLILLTTRFVDQSRATRTIYEVVRSEIAIMPDAQLVDIQQGSEGKALRLTVTIRSPRLPTYEEVVAMQERVAEHLQRPVAVVVIDVPIVKLDPLTPPTRTPTATATPKPTLTATPGKR